METSKTLIEVKNVCQEFHLTKGLLQSLRFEKGKLVKEDKVVHAVNDVSFEIKKGEVFSLVGESGCGKSTTARTVIRLLEPTSGQVLYKGKDISHLGPNELLPYRKSMQMIFQDPYASLNPRQRVADIIMEAILGTLSGENNKLLMLGNPTKTSGVFYDSHTVDRALYKCHTVNSENVARVNKKNIENLKKKYGKDSNVVRVRVYGEFPTQEDDVFIPLYIIEQCSSKLYELPDNNKLPYIILGVDIARFGNDETIIYRNAQGRLKIMAERKGQDLMATAGDVIRIYKKTIFPVYKPFLLFSSQKNGKINLTTMKRFG